MSTVDLCRFKAAEVLKIAQSMHVELEEAGDHDAPAGSSEVMFRDRDGTYWSVDRTSNLWYCHSRGRWRRSDPPEGILEGPLLHITGPTPKLPEPGKVEPIKSQVELFETIVGRAREEYAQGSITSVAAEALIKGVVAIDREGDPCTVGVRSGDWYSFKKNTWKRMPRPDSSMLLDNDALIWPALQEFLSTAPGLPEQVTDPWNPPPTRIRETPPSRPITRTKCTKCGAELPADSLFCIECGAPRKFVRKAEPPLTSTRRSRFADITQRIPTSRMLFGILLSVGIAALSPYIYYLALNVKLDQTVAAVMIFTISLLMTFSFFAYSLKKRRT